jgi:DNA-directed RNA polymerase specialized sigma24 family protein
LRSSNPPSDPEQIVAEIARDPVGVLTRFLPLIGRITAWVGRRQGLPLHEVEELNAEVRLRLLESDCARLRAYAGRSSFESYLSVCVQRLAHDLRDKKLGSWEPSAEARRIGPRAVRLETLWVRDGLTLDECEQTLEPLFPDLSREEIEEIAVRLPIRTRRRQEGDDGLDRRPAPTPTPDLQFEEREGFAVQREVLAALGEERAKLSAEDQLLVCLRIDSGFRVSEIPRQCAPSLGIEQKALYPRFEKIFATLKRGLLERGISPEDARTALRFGGRDEEELP